ncbi:MAG: hypothetical protein GY832_11570 [Chloroflexi bacterium]|nr:hypothetical protein [Chloroflexota bacterium]
MDARIDQQKYQAGCRTMENFYPLIHGGAERRPGTYYANEVKDSSAKTRLVPFEFSLEYAYVLEFGNQYIRVYKGRNTDAEAGLLVGALLGSNPAWADATNYINGDIIEYSSVIYRCLVSHTAATGGGDGAGGEPDTNTTQWVAPSETSDSYPIYEIVTPYLTADLFQLKFEHSNDVMWITHDDYEPRRLSRISLCSWTLTEEAFEDGPFLDTNTDAADTISASATTGTVTLTAVGCEPFVTGTTAGHSPSGTAPTSKSVTGCLFKLLHAAEEQSVEASFTTADATSSSLTINKGVTWDFSTNGTWTGKVVLERSYDDTVWETVHEVVSNNNANEKLTGEEDFADASYRMRTDLGPFSAWSGTALCQISVRNYDNIGVVEITSVASSTSATGTVISTLGSTDATHRWAEGYWSNYRGWPSCVAISPEERLTFAGSTTYPLTVWGSKSGDYTSMDIGTGNDDDAVIFTLVGSGKQNAIVWMLSRNTLMLGTVGGEHLLGASSEDEALTPTNVKAKVQSMYGSANIQALLVNDAILFVQKGGRRVREMSYSFERDGFVADDLTVMANHITEGGITCWDYQRAPDPMVWCVRDDGEMAIMSYEREQNVWAWSRLTTSDNTSQSSFESVAVVSTPFEEDQVWAIVKRTIGGSTVRYVEYFAPRGF